MDNQFYAGDSPAVVKEIKEILNHDNITVYVKAICENYRIEKDLLLRPSLGSYFIKRTFENDHNLLFPQPPSHIPSTIHLIQFH
ncbi:hypothetical protein KCTC52924_03404 [Arenibacter antarcticus]